MLAAGSGTLLIGLLSTSIQPVRLDLSLDWRVLGFTGVVAVVTALIFGTAPAVRAAGTDPIRALGEGHRHGPSADAGRQYAVGLALSHAMCLILVLAAGLFVRTFATLATVPLGFEPDSLLVATVETSRAGVQPTARPLLFQELVERAKSVPGVAAAAASSITPVGGNSLIDVVNRPNEAPTDELFEGPGRPSTRASLVNYVTPGWFGAYGIPVRAGRDIAGADTAATPAVAVVNQAFVDRFYPGSSPLGARFSGLTGVQKTIVGIVSDAVYESPKDGPRPTIYMPLAQFDWANSSNSSVAITVQAASGPPMHLARSLSAAFSDVNSALLVAYRPMADQVQAAIIPERAMAMLSALFGGLALLLASIGLYGVTSHGVAMRRRELGIRMALGASGSAVVGLMLRRHLRVTGLGVVLGLTGAAFGATYVDSMLFGITPLDPGTWLGVSGLMMAVALVATYLPARRARRSDPLAVLRAE
jgi:predicted permease